MKSIFFNAVIMLMLAIATSACKKEPGFEAVFADGVEFCSCLDLENINKTIPLVNNFLAELPEKMKLDKGWEHQEDIFEFLEAGLKSLPCNVNARILYGIDMIWGQEQMYGVGISVMDNEKVRELEFDFAIIDNMIAYTQIQGYSHVKQDAIHVKTKLSKINEVFDIINSLGLDVKHIEGGTYISSMLPINTETLQYIVENLKSKPYTHNSWVTGHLNWYTTGITLFVNLYDMHKKDYQDDWVKTMSEYQLVEWNFEMTIVFFIPEGTGEEWKTKFEEYDFVHWAEPSHTRYTIR